MSEWSQRRKVSVDTPAAVASSDLSIAFIGFRSNFPQLLSAFLGAFCLHPCNDLGDGGKTLFGSGLRRCRGFGGAIRTALDKGLAVDGFEIERRLAVDLAA